jgi:NAD/NADP transhydrogenase beta subunit
VTSLTNSPYTSIVIAILVVAFVCYRQLQTRNVREERGLVLYVLVFALGVLQTVTFVQKHSVGATVLILVIVSLVVGLGLGALRGRLVHLWRSGGQLMRRGNAWTVALWVVGIALHLGIDLFSTHLDKSAEGFASSTLLVYIGLALGAQRFVLLGRARSIVEHPDEAPTAY